MELVFEIICDLIIEVVLEGLVNVVVSRKRAVLRWACAMVIVAGYLAIAGGLLYLAVTVKEALCRFLFFAFLLLVTGLFIRLCWNIGKRIRRPQEPEN